MVRPIVVRVNTTTNNYVLVSDSKMSGNALQNRHARENEDIKSKDSSSKYLKALEQTPDAAKFSVVKPNRIPISDEHANHGKSVSVERIFSKSMPNQISRFQAPRPMNTESLLKQASQFDVGPRIVSDTLDPHNCELIKRKEGKKMEVEDEPQAPVVRDLKENKPNNTSSSIRKEMAIENLQQNLRQAAGHRSNLLTPSGNASMSGNRPMLFGPSVVAYMKSMEDLKKNSSLFRLERTPNGENSHSKVNEAPIKPTTCVHQSNEPSYKPAIGTAASLSFHNQAAAPIMNLSQKINGNKRGRPKRDPREGWPKRPLSAYNIFFKDIRQEIVGSEEDTPMYDSVGNSLKPHSRRRRRKKHGKISFGGLAKAVGAMWKKLPAEKVAFYEARAEESREAYRKEIQLFLQKRSAAQRGHHI